MVTENKDSSFDDVDLNELFSGINTNEMVNHLNQYTSALSSFFTQYTTTTSNTLMRVFDVFDSNSFDQREAEFVRKSLNLANYDERALQGEVVVLFPSPVIVSELSCKNMPSSETEGAVRLISYSGRDKKFASKRTTRKIHPVVKAGLLYTYQIHDVVLGFILPKRSVFHSVSVASLRALHTEPDKLEQAKDALNNAREIPLIEIQKIVGKFEQINSIIDIQRDKFESITSDISVLEKERSHAESSLSNSQSTLDKVRKDIDKSSREYEKLSKAIVDGSETLSSIEEKIKLGTDLYRKEESRLKSLLGDTENASDGLKVVQQQLADANRQKNLTTLDMVGHSNETSKQLRPYYLLAVFTFIALAWMAKYIYQNGESFIDTLPFLVHVSAWDILLSRLPLITATTLIIGGLSGVFFFLVKHIVSLNTEKMTMLKAAILAEQITNSIDCKDMNEQEKIEFKRDTKIKLITQVFSKNEPDIDKTSFIMDVLKAISDKKQLKATVYLALFNQVR